MPPRLLPTRRTLLYVLGGTALTTSGGIYYLNSGPAYPSSRKETRRPPPAWTPPSRNEMIERLKASGGGKGSVAKITQDQDQEEFDLLIVGGGATGAGVALDAASRGLKVALVERDDFSSGTSSKSTKLVHGGVRYLQKAVFELDYSQYKLVREALHERRIFLQTAPYLSNMLPIMLPVYKVWQVPYYWAGCKLYDLLAGKENMESSYVMSKGKALETFPMLKSDGLVGAVVYYDGQHNDSRMNIALIMTAVKHGATVANYVEVTSLDRDPSTGKLIGATLRDNLTHSTFRVRAKGIVNATGPFTDSLLTLDNPSHKPIVQASSGVHITLPGYYSPRTMGLLDPATSDGRVIFFLPWQGNTIAGTTDSPSGVVVDEPEASEEDVRWLLEEVRRYLSPDIKVRRGDVLSAWSGLRPLVRNPEAAQKDGTAGLVRSHVTHVSPSGLLTIAGGKWTTYRKMAEETVDEAVRVFGLEERVRSGCVTDRVRLVGSDGWSRNMFIGLIQTYGLETEVARHLSDNYGDRAWTVCSLAEPTGANWPLYGTRIVSQYPFIEAEIRYAIRHEYAQTAIDVLARRTRLSFLNARAALDALPRVIGIMSSELGWSKDEQTRQADRAVRFLVGSMGLVGDERALREGVRARMRVGGTGWVESVKGVGRTLGIWSGATEGDEDGKRTSVEGGEEVVGAKPVYGRSRFEPGELALLRSRFVASCVPSSSAPDSGELVVPTSSVLDLVRTWTLASGLGGTTSTTAPTTTTLSPSTSKIYASATKKDLEYVLGEAGLKEKRELDFDEVVEVVGNLKEVVGVEGAFGVVGGGGGVKGKGKVKREDEKRTRIPVEKSGGGV